MSDRGDRLAGLLAEQELDALLVTSLPNVRYLTGYTGSNGLAVVSPSTRAFVTDFRYVEQAEREVDRAFDRRHAQHELLEGVGGVLGSGPLRLGFEDSHLTVRQHHRLRELLDERVELVAAGELVERLRAVKEPGELDRIRAAAELADDAFRAWLSDGLVGRTERELATALERAMIDRGAERVSFNPIVAGGPQGALPHAHPRAVPIPEGTLVVVDWGAELDGYCSDCTRTVAAGEVDAEAREVYELVLRAERVGVESVRAGADGREIDAQARALIEDAGHAEHFGHGLGHGVGVEVHEAPTLSRRSKDRLSPGNVVTVEPGVYLPGRLGVRIEDLVVVGEDGAEVLTSLDRELVVCG